MRSGEKKKNFVSYEPVHLMRWFYVLPHWQKCRKKICICEEFHVRCSCSHHAHTYVRTVNEILWRSIVGCPHEFEQLATCERNYEKNRKRSRRLQRQVKLQRDKNRFFFGVWQNSTESIYDYDPDCLIILLFSSQFAQRAKQTCYSEAKKKKLNKQQKKQ